MAASWLVSGVWSKPTTKARRVPRTQVEIVPVALFIGIAIPIVGILIGIIGFIWAKRTGRYITRWKYVISPLNRSERRWALKQVRGRIEPDTKIMPILVALARQLRAGMLGVAPLYVAIALMSLGTATWTFEGLPPIIIWLIVGGVALMIIGGIFMARDYRLAGRFIARYGEQASAAQ